MSHRIGVYFKSETGVTGISQIIREKKGRECEGGGDGSGERRGHPDMFRSWCIYVEV